jgi:aminoglycoside phosphotransferase (APT) family kinase protein
MRDGGRVSAVIDLEMAIIGDPMADLASMRLRDTIEPTGDLGSTERRGGVGATQRPRREDTEFRSPMREPMYRRRHP